MRNDLQFLEEVDQYLSGEMKGPDKLVFEESLNKDAELREIVETQKHIIEAAKRKALLIEIQTIGASFQGTSWIAANAKWILSAVIIGAISIPIALSYTAEKHTNTRAKHLPRIDSTVYNDREQPHTDVPNSKTKITKNTIFEEEESEENSFVQPISNDFSFFSTFREFNKVKEDSEEQIQEVKKELKDKYTYSNAKVYNRQVSFPEGNLALKNFVNTRINYPSEAFDKGIDGNVKVDFIVKENGEISEMNANCFNLSKSNASFTEQFSALQMFFNKKVISAFENEVIRVMELMPNWTYATNKRGEAVPCKITLYFDFNNTSETIVYQLNKPEFEKAKGSGWKY